MVVAEWLKTERVKHWDAKWREWRTQWESNPSDLWDPRRYDPTIAIHMDKLIQDSDVLHRTDGITTRNDAASENVISLYGSLWCPLYKHDDLSNSSLLSREPFLCIRVHASCKSFVFIFNIRDARHKHVWLFNKLFWCRFKGQ